MGPIYIHRSYCLMGSFYNHLIGRDRASATCKIKNDLYKIYSFVKYPLYGWLYIPFPTCMFFFHTHSQSIKCSAILYCRDCCFSNVCVRFFLSSLLTKELYSNLISHPFELSIVLDHSLCQFLVLFATQKDD